jgi:hypothetical protein
LRLAGDINNQIIIRNKFKFRLMYFFFLFHYTWLASIHSMLWIGGAHTRMWCSYIRLSKQQKELIHILLFHVFVALSVFWVYNFNACSSLEPTMKRTIYSSIDDFCG